MIRLLVADDHAIVRGGLKQIFALVPDFQVIAEATQGGEVLEQLRQHTVDLLLLDLNMPGISGADLIVRVKGHWPVLPVLVLSMHNEPLIALRVLKAGANGFITKDSEPEVLVAAIRKVAAGGKYITPELAEKMVFDAGASAAPAHTLLSERELTIFHLLTAGKTVNDIAAQLSVSNKTISTHKARLMEKMNLGSIADLTRYAVEHKLLS